MKLAEMLRHFRLTSIVGIDFETYYDDDYSLKKMATTDYVYDTRFQMQMASVQRHSERRAKVFNEKQFRTWAKSINWSRTGVLCHHAHFDGLILSKHFGIHPKAFFDTLSMARPVMPIQVPLSLDALCHAFKLPGKVGTSSLENVNGLRELSTKQYKALAKYAGNDIEQTWALFKKLEPYTTLEELRIISATVRMYTSPSILINQKMVDQVYSKELSDKANLLKKLRTTKTALGSSDQFAAMLRKAGCPIPMKMPKTLIKKHGKEIEHDPEWADKKVPAFAKTDLEFKALLHHPRKVIRELVEARLRIKSNILENRSKRMAARAPIGAQPIYLTYWAAKTGRWGGSDKMNWQNLQRLKEEDTVHLRLALHARKGRKFIIADQAQIEARLTAWLAGQQNILDAFRNKQDVYKIAAMGIYGKRLEDITKDERFVGKTATLALGFQAGAIRFANTLRVGQFGPPMDISDADAKRAVDAWRMANSRIRDLWYAIENVATSAFMGEQAIDFKILQLEGTAGKGFIHLPNGTSIRYDGIKTDSEGKVSYVSKYRHLVRGGATIERTKLYGGIYVENVIQSLARANLVHQMVQIEDALPMAQIALTVHDEVLLDVSENHAERALKIVTQIMTTPPAWALDLPFAVDAKISDVYDKR